MESLIIAYDKNMHWIYPDLISVLSKKFHFLWNGPFVILSVVNYLELSDVVGLFINNCNYFEIIVNASLRITLSIVRVN